MLCPVYASIYVEWTIPQTLSGELQATKLDPKNRLMSSKPKTLSGQLNQTGYIETVAALSPGFPLHRYAARNRMPKNFSF
jgi:hypothetical protein